MFWLNFFVALRWVIPLCVIAPFVLVFAVDLLNIRGARFMYKMIHGAFTFGGLLMEDIETSAVLGLLATTMLAPAIASGMAFSKISSAAPPLSLLYSILIGIAAYSIMITFLFFVGLVACDE